MSALYGLAKQSLLSQNPSIDLDSNEIRVALVSSGYTANTATNGHQFLNSVGTHTVATASIGSKTITGGVFDGADVTFSAVAANTAISINQLVIYQHNSTAATSGLLIAVVTNASSGFPIQPNGGDITVSWDNGANKIFAL